MQRRATLPAVLSILALVAAGCQTAPKNTVDIKALLEERSGRVYVSGATRGLGEPAVVNDRDFVYAVAFNQATDELAFVHHVSTFMELSLTSLDPVERRFQTPVNHHQFDVEDVAFVERDDVRYVVAPSRQGSVRRFDVQSGEASGELIYGQPLLRVAVNPSHTLIAAGSADGRVLVLDAATLAIRGEARPHADEVHGLAFTDDNTLVSVGFDGQLVALALEPGRPEVVRVASAALEQGARVFLAHLEGSQAISTIRDVRQPHNVITSAAVKRLGLESVVDGSSLPVQGPLGEVQSPVVELGEVQVRYLTLGRMRAAVCDACVPPGAELVLGQESLRRVAIGDDVATGEVLLRPGTTQGVPAVDGEAPMTAQPVPGALALKELHRVALPGPATDIDVDAARRTALVSYSHAPAVRTLDLYEAEKKGIYPPPSPASGAVLVDLEGYALGRRFIGHNGFTVTAALSPDGRTVATGGWDERVLVFDVETGKLVTERKLAWLLRRLRFSPDGRFLAAAAWTPTNPLGDGKSEPALLVYPVVFDNPEAKGGARAASAD